MSLSQRQFMSHESIHKCIAIIWCPSRRTPACPFRCGASGITTLEIASSLQQTVRDNSGAITLSWRHLFLATLLDALVSGVERSLATGLAGHLLASLLVCENVS